MRKFTTEKYSGEHSDHEKKKKTPETLADMDIAELFFYYVFNLSIVLSPQCLTTFKNFILPPHKTPC